MSRQPALSRPTPTSIIARARSEISLQRSRISTPLFIASVGTALGIVSVIAISALGNIPAPSLTRDTLAVVNKPVYIGMLSNIGIMVWAAATATWLFGWALLRRARPEHYLRSFVLASGLFTLVLLVDDAFMLHELVLPVVLGIPEPLVLFGYVIAAGAYGWGNWRHMLRTSYVPGIISGSFLAASLGIDALLVMSPLETVVEDSLKFAGILFWLAYAITVLGQVVDDGHTR